MEKHYLFVDDETGEEFLVGAPNLEEAKEIAAEYFEDPRPLCTLTWAEAEMSGLDEY